MYYIILYYAHLAVYVYHDPALLHYEIKLPRVSPETRSDYFRIHASARIRYKENEIKNNNNTKLLRTR